MLPDNETTPHHFLVCGAMPVFLAALLNAEKGLAPVAPDPDAHDGAGSPAHDPRPAAPEVFEKALDTYLATIIDHGLNASTFTARVVASTEPA